MSGPTSESSPPDDWSADDRYDVRRFESADLDGLRALDRAVWDRDRSAAWFRWKYVENPYVDHVPIFVVERDGEIVGARPFLAFRLRVGSDAVLALQPADTMVHPDHRRQGLFTRMTSRAIEFYEPRAPRLFFNFPNEAALGGYRSLGWRAVGPRRAHYRVQNPATFVESHVDGRAGDVLGALATPVAQQYYRVRRRRFDPADSITVERRDGADGALLASLYERDPPPELHAHRDREFYDWYLSSPAWTYATFVAHRHGSIVAALLARTRTTDDGIRVTQLADVAPLHGDENWTSAVAALVASAVDDAADVDLIAAIASAIPSEILTTHGLSAGTDLPLRRLRGEPSTFVVRPVGVTDPDPWQLDGRPLTDRSSWRVSFCEHDTA